MIMYFLYIFFSQVQECPASLERPWRNRGHKVKAVQQSDQAEGKGLETPHPPPPTPQK